MLISILNDTHYGVRNDAKIFMDNMASFFTKQFIPYLKDNNIKNIIHLGDVFDRRKYVNYNTLAAVNDFYIKPLVENNIVVDHILRKS